MTSASYFAQGLAEKRRLMAHGFDHHPDSGELADYAFAQSDRLDALIEALGLEATRDVRGRWHIERAHGEVS